MLAASSSPVPAFPNATRVALIGPDALVLGLSEALERRGFAPRPSCDTMHGDADTFAGACEALIFVARPGEEASAVRDCRRHAARFAGSMIVVYLGQDTSFAIDALDAGADDCVRAPVNPREVVARLRAALRRRRMASDSSLQTFGEYSLDHVQLSVRAPNQADLHLTKAQSQLLRTLLGIPGRTVSRDELLAKVLGDESDSFDRAIDVQVCRLRKRLELIGLARLIETVPGVGYRIAKFPPPATARGMALHEENIH